MGAMLAELGLGCELGENKNQINLELSAWGGGSAGRGPAYQAGSPGFIPQHSIN